MFNLVKTAVLMAAITALFMLIGSYIGGQTGMLVALLASALDKIHRVAQGIPLAPAEAHPETAQMMIMNPLSGGGLRELFSTHPSTEERITRLLAMAER